MKSQFTPQELHEQFARALEPVEQSEEELVTLIWAMFSAPTNDGYPTIDELGLDVDFVAIARAVKQWHAEHPTLTFEQFQPLGEQWLEWQEQVGDTENPQTAFALSYRLEELEAQLPAEFLAGLSVALEWHLKQALEQMEEQPRNPHLEVKRAEQS